MPHAHPQVEANQIESIEKSITHAFKISQTYILYDSRVP